MTMALDTQSTFKSELRIIPTAGWVAAGVFLLFWSLVAAPLILGATKHQPGQPPVAVLVGLLIFGGVVLSLWVLMVFYVNADAGRRQMNRLLWTLLVIFIPNAIGFIIYFVIRRPIARPCPKCQAPIRPEFVFCPACGQEVAAKCPGCNHAVESGWVACAFCGARLG